jgi:hypothetical protein
VLVLIVTIGILNVCIGFGMAMYFGYGPPGLDGIHQALAPMPSVTPDASSPVAAGLGALYIPGGDDAAGQSNAMPAAAAAQIGPGDSLSEEGVFGDVRELTAVARTAMPTAALQAQD